MPRPSWRTITDLAKQKQWPLRIADRLGRGHGRFRFLDRLGRIPPAPVKPDLSNWTTRTLSAVWIGHATVLLRIGGLTILTDPVFSPRVGIGLGLITAGPRRLQQPALTIEELPPIDLILLSHAHFDHLDLPSLARLPKSSHVVTYRGVGDLISGLGFASITEIDWGEIVQRSEITISGLPVTHWGARTFFDTHRRYGAFLLETSMRRVLYGADTAFHERWIGLGPVDLAILGIGAYDPYIAAHASPEQANAIADHVGARFILPIHHSTFVLSREPIGDPLCRFKASIRSAPDRLIVEQIGDSWTSA